MTAPLSLCLTCSLNILAGKACWAEGSAVPTEITYARNEIACTPVLMLESSVQMYENFFLDILTHIRLKMIA